MIKEPQVTIPVSNNRTNGHIGPSTNQWVTATAKLKIEISAYHQSGHYFHHEQKVSLDLLEYGEPKSHTHEMGGDLDMKAQAIVDQFYEDKNIEKIFVYVENHDIDLFLVLSEEVDKLALRLAKLQKQVSKSNPDRTIGIIYTTKEYFSKEHVPDGAQLYPRRK